MPLPVSNHVVYPSSERRDQFSRSGVRRLSNFQRFRGRFKKYRRDYLGAPTSSSDGFDGVPASVPAPPLVGVEPNPGPRSSNPKTTSKSTKARPRRRARGVILAGGGTATSSQQIIRVGRAPTNSSVQSYLRVLRDPWFAPPIRLGFGSFIPTSIRSTWNNVSIAPTSTATCFVYIGTPAIGQGIPATNLGYGQYYNTTSPDVPLTGVPSTPYPAANHVAFGAAVDTCRVIAGAVRVTVRYAATSVRGSLWVGYMADDSSFAVLSKTFTALTNVYSMRRCHSTAGGEIGGESQYRPSDSSSFNFDATLALDATGAVGAASSIPQLIVVGTGWAAGSFSLDVNQIFHYECLSGLDAGGDDAGGDSLAATGATLDQVGHASASLGEPVITSVAGMDAVDMAYSGLTHAMRLTNGSYRGNIAPSAGNGAFMMI